MHDSISDGICQAVERCVPLQTVYSSFQLAQSLLQHAAGAGGIEPHIPVQAPTEGAAVIQAQLRLLDHEVVEFFICESQFPAVQPHEIGGVGGVSLDFGDVLFAVVHHEVKVGGEVGQKLLQPFLAACAEGGLHGGEGKGVVPVNVHALPEVVKNPLHVGIGEDHGTGLQAGQVEGLGTGTFATHYYVFPKQHFYKVPDTLPDSLAAGANCRFSQIYYGLEHLKPVAGETVLIQGAGSMGLYASAIGKELGLTTIVIDSVAERLEMAKRFGADHVISMVDYPTLEEREKAVK